MGFREEGDHSSKREVSYFNGTPCVRSIIVPRAAARSLNITISRTFTREIAGNRMLEIELLFELFRRGLVSVCGRVNTAAIF